MSADLVLVSHHLCPYVQRAAIAMTEKGVTFTRQTIDFADKPDWFKAISPLGKVPLLRVDDDVIFELAAILEYLEDAAPNPLHPVEPVERARHRGWIEYASSLLNDIAGFYNARDQQALVMKAGVMATKFRHLEDQLAAGPWFAGPRFSLVDAAFAPVFLYFNVFDDLGDWNVLPVDGRLHDWRGALHERPSVRQAVDDDYPERLRDFLARRDSHLSGYVVNDAKPAISQVPAA